MSSLELVTTKTTQLITSSMTHSPKLGTSINQCTIPILTLKSGPQSNQTNVTLNATQSLFQYFQNHVPSFPPPHMGQQFSMQILPATSFQSIYSTLIPRPSLATPLSRAIGISPKQTTFNSPLQFGMSFPYPYMQHYNVNVQMFPMYTPSLNNTYQPKFIPFHKAFFPIIKKTHT